MGINNIISKDLEKSSEQNFTFKLSEGAALFSPWINYELKAAHDGCGPGKTFSPQDFGSVLKEQQYSRFKDWYEPKLYRM